MVSMRGDAAFAVVAGTEASTTAVSLKSPVLCPGRLGYSSTPLFSLYYPAKVLNIRSITAAQTKISM